MDIAHAKRVATVIATRPREAVSRTRSRLEILLDRSQRWAPRDFLPEQETSASVHQLLGVHGCECHWISDVWARLEASSAKAHSHDASRSLVTAVCVAIEHVPASVVVETGVARGFTSFAALSALDRRDTGILSSIDLPPILAGWDPATYGSAVPGHLRKRWRLHRGSTRAVLPKVLADLEQIDVFIHDSLHTKWTMSFEFAMAWDALRPGGVLISDDIQLNRSFDEFRSKVAAPSLVIVDDRGRHTGVLRKR